MTKLGKYLSMIISLIVSTHCSSQVEMSRLQIRLTDQLDTLFTNRLETCCSPSNECPAYEYITWVQNGFRHKDGQCEMFLYHSPLGMARSITKHEDVLIGDLTMFNRIRGNYHWGTPHEWKPSKQDISDLDMLLTWLPKKRARRLFNADCAAIYPMNFKGKKCRNKFSWGRAIVFQSGSGLCYLYLIFTDSAKPFEKYLDDIKGAFTLETCKKKVPPM